MRSLDAGGISIQVISHIANNIAIDAVTCIKVNNELASLIKQRPTRFAAYAILPPWQIQRLRVENSIDASLNWILLAQCSTVIAKRIEVLRRSDAIELVKQIRSLGQRSSAEHNRHSKVI